MDKSTIENFKNLFTQIKNEQALKAKDLNDVFENLDNRDEVDLALEERERQLKLKLKGRDSFFLKKVVSALARIENGTFGDCEECGCEIEINRLYARPTATMCINCKEEQEKGEGHILYKNKSHTLGKEIINENVLSFALKQKNEQGQIRSL